MVKQDYLWHQGWPCPPSLPSGTLNVLKVSPFLTPQSLFVCDCLITCLFVNLCTIRCSSYSRNTKLFSQYFQSMTNIVRYRLLGAFQDCTYILEEMGSVSGKIKLIITFLHLGYFKIITEIHLRSLTYLSYNFFFSFWET